MSIATCSASIKLLPFRDPLRGDARFENRAEICVTRTQKNGQIRDYA
jgi:hypothetical protein